MPPNQRLEAPSTGRARQAETHLAVVLAIGQPEGMLTPHHPCRKTADAESDFISCALR